MTEAVEATLASGPAGHHELRLAVARTLVGTELEIPVQILRGASSGPVLAVLGGMHGDESGSFPILRSFWTKIDTAHLRGTVVLIPVANPLAWAAASRFTPSLHGVTDLHAVFPGDSNGTLTQMMAATITDRILASLGAGDVFVDLHSGGAGGRLQRRVDFDYQVGGALRKRTLELCRVFGTELIHENNLAGTASAWLNERGVPTVNVELGGAYLGGAAEEEFVKRGVDGLRRIASRMGLIDVVSSVQPRQYLFDRRSRIEVNPKVGGYLDSLLQSPDSLGMQIKEGDLLGRVFDPYRFALLEELVSPTDGFLFFTRYSGVVEAGSKVFGIAREESSTCR